MTTLELAADAAGAKQLSAAAANPNMERRNVDLTKQRNPCAPPRAIRLAITAAPDEKFFPVAGILAKRCDNNQTSSKNFPRGNPE
jgi:hypothetical protein